MRKEDIFSLWVLVLFFEVGWLFVKTQNLQQEFLYEPNIPKYREMTDSFGANSSYFIGMGKPR